MQFKGHRLLLQCFSSKYISTSHISGAKPRVAIVGSGPAGFYTAHKLLKVFVISHLYTVFILLLICYN